MTVPPSSTTSRGSALRYSSDWKPPRGSSSRSRGSGSPCWRVAVPRLRPKMRWRKPTRESLGGARPVGAGESEPHQGAPVLGALGADAAAVGLCHLFHDRQAQPGAGQLPRRRGAVEAVENVREVVLVDARAVIAHDHLAVAHLDLDLAAGRAPLRRVVEQVRDCARDRVRDAVELAGTKIGHELDLRKVTAVALDDLFHKEVEPHVLGLLGLRLAT